jgi:hypothetical protein
LWHDDVSNAERWLERVKKTGFHGIRVFGEHHWWDGPFYGLYPLAKPWNVNMSPGSRFHISGKHKQMLRLALNLLKQHDLIMEYTVIATLKHHAGGHDPRAYEDVIGWNSHAMRVMAEFFREIDATNILPETINECGAHIPIRFRLGDDIYPTVHQGRLTNKYLLELGNEARRWKKRDWPGSPIGVSQGGWDFQYPVGTQPSGYTHVNIHSPRQGEWERVGAGIDETRRRFPACPVYLNENIHYMNQAQWDEWTPKLPNWARLSTTNAARVQDQWNTAYQHGASYCVHDLVGQATDPSWPLSRLEELWQRLADAFKGFWGWLKTRLGL